MLSSNILNILHAIKIDRFAIEELLAIVIVLNRGRSPFAVYDNIDICTYVMIFGWTMFEAKDKLFLLILVDFSTY